MAAKAVLIAGPTASGKSALALAAARATGAAIVNADSMQVYRELSALTARPDAAETASVPHHLYGHVSVRETYSAGRYLEEVRAALAALAAEGRPAIVAGGTGLYFRALTEGLADIPAIPEAVREAARAEMARLGPAAFHGRLAAADPAAGASLHPSDTQRTIRAWEVLEATRRPLSVWQAGRHAPAALGADTPRFVLAPERGWLAARIAARFDTMIAAGALEEVRALMEQGLDLDRPAFKALGVRDLARQLRGEISPEGARTAVLAQTRRYAKRQMTWFRHQMVSCTRLDPQQSSENTALIIKIIAESS